MVKTAGIKFACVFVLLQLLNLKFQNIEIYMADPRIGIIQPGGIGDIIISLPIAKYYFDKGYKIYFPIDKKYINSFVGAAPYINFITLESTTTVDDVIYKPTQLLKDLNCQIFNLISYISANPELVVNLELAKYLKFDQYKFAIANVPFGLKWNLAINRDYKRELDFYEKVVPFGVKEYSVVQLRASQAEIKLNQISNILSTNHIIEINNLTTNIFDWLTVIERAKELVLLESCFSNLVDQLNLPNKKTLILKAQGLFNPVLLNDWNYAWMNT